MRKNIGIGRLMQKLKMLLIPVCAVFLVMGTYRTAFFLLSDGIKTKSESTDTAEQTDANDGALPVGADGMDALTDEGDEVEIILLARYLLAVEDTYRVGIGEMETIGHIMRNRVTDVGYPDTLFDVLVQDAATRFSGGASLLIQPISDDEERSGAETASTAARNAFLGADTSGGALLWGGKNEREDWRMTIGEVGFR